MPLWAQLQLVMPQIREPGKYEDNSYDNRNSSAQPFGHWLFVWPGPTHEGWVKCVRSEAENDSHNSHNYLKDVSCQGCLLLDLGSRSEISANVHASTFIPSGRCTG